MRSNYKPINNFSAIECQRRLRRLRRAEPSAEQLKDVDESTADMLREGVRNSNNVIKESVKILQPLADMERRKSKCKKKGKKK